MRGRRGPLDAIIDVVIRRFHVHNYRCLENFELSLGSNQSAALLMGKNGTGKSTVRNALEVLQRVGRGDTRVGTLVPPDAIAWGRAEVPLRFEVEIDVAGRVYVYSLAFELPKGFKELRIFEEKLTADGETVFHREMAKVRLVRAGRDSDATFNVDWHIVALPVLQDRGGDDPIAVVRRWLAEMVLIEPVPSLIKGESRESNEKSRAPSSSLENLGDWFTNLVAGYPAAYGPLEAFLKGLMPDLKAIRNPEKAPGYRSLELEFSKGTRNLMVPFADLSSGEKCFFAGALVIAAKESGGARFCFWDEPDSHWALNEVGDFVIALRKAFETGGQFIATSHNPETIRHFSLDNTLLLHRRSHLEPTQVRPLSELEISGDVVTSLILGDLEP